MLEGIFNWLVPIIIILLIFGIIGYIFLLYNRFMALKNSAEATLGQIKVAMKKRLDMVTELLGAVKSYASFERETFERVTSMRTKITNAGPGDLNEVEKESGSLLGRIFAVFENYPVLKTSETVTNLMGSIRGVEDEIARQRYTYNNVGQEFNTMCDTIPSNFVARLMKLRKIEYLEFESEIATPPKIEF